MSVSCLLCPSTGKVGVWPGKKSNSLPGCIKITELDWWTGLQDSYFCQLQHLFRMSRSSPTYVDRPLPYCIIKQFGLFRLLNFIHMYQRTITSMQIIISDSKSGIWKQWKWKTETENWNDQNENCLLSNAYLSKKTTCTTRPPELRYTVNFSISYRL